MTPLTGMWVMERHMARDWLRNRTLWIMLLLPTGIFWAVLHTGTPPHRRWFVASWLLFAQVMTGLMIAASYWLEEREQGTWQALRVSSVSIGWLMGAQAVFVGLLAVVSQAGVLMVSGGHWHGSLGLGMVLGGFVFTGFGLLIGITSPAQRTGSLIAAALMIVFFLSALIWPGLGENTGIHAWLSWSPAIVTVRVMRAGLQGSPLSWAMIGAMGGYGSLIIALLIRLLHREYHRGLPM